MFITIANPELDKGAEWSHSIPVNYVNIKVNL